MSDEQITQLRFKRRALKARARYARSRIAYLTTDAQSCDAQAEALALEIENLGGSVRR